jgi:hypothetical protein
MATKKELEDTISDVKMLFDPDCGIFKRFDNIDHRLDRYNGNIGHALEEITETNNKIEKAREIAEAAKIKAAEACQSINDKDTGLDSLNIKINGNSKELGFIKWIGGSLMTILTALIIFIITRG